MNWSKVANKFGVLSVIHAERANMDMKEEYEEGCRFNLTLSYIFEGLEKAIREGLDEGHS